MRRGALLHFIALALVASSAYAISRFDESRYLPGVLHHLDKAKTSLEEGQTSLSLAHSEIILHEKSLAVYVDLSQVPEELQATCRNAADRSLKYWNNTLGSASLVEVQGAELAKLRISFSKEVELRGQQVGGYCSQSRGVTVSGEGEATPEYSAAIYARFNLPNGPILNEDALTNIVTHELGHVYGLRDTVEPEYLMSPLNPTKPKFELHPYELDALQQLRLTVFELQRSAVARIKDN